MDRPNGTVRGEYPQFFFIDVKGNVAIDTYDWLFPIAGTNGGFSEGYVPVIYRERLFGEYSEKWAYMDINGNYLGDGHQFLIATPFSEGLALVKTGDTWGYVDKAGQLVIDLGNSYDYSREGNGIMNRRFFKGKAPVKKDGNDVFIDKKGITLRTLYWDEQYRMCPFSDTPIWSTQKDYSSGLYGFVDPDRKEITEWKFEDASQVSQGMAAVKVGGKWGVIEFPAYIQTDEVPIVPNSNDEGAINAHSEAELLELQQTVVGEWLDADGNLAYTITEDLSVTTRNGLSGSCYIKDGELVMSYGMTVKPNELPTWVISLPSADRMVLTYGEQRQELTRKPPAPQSGGLSAKDIEKNIVGTWVRQTSQGEEKLRFMKDGTYDTTSVMGIVTSGIYYFESGSLYIRMSALLGASVEAEFTPFMDSKDSLWLTDKNGDSENYTRKK